MVSSAAAPFGALATAGQSPSAAAFTRLEHTGGTGATGGLPHHSQLVSSHLAGMSAAGVDMMGADAASLSAWAPSAAQRLKRERSASMDDGAGGEMVDENEEKRKKRNRASAALSRRRRQQYVAQLEQAAVELRRQQEALAVSQQRLMQENEVLQRRYVARASVGVQDSGSHACAC